MKRIQSFLTAAAFIVAIGGALAFNYNTFATAYRSDSCNTPVLKPGQCNSTDVNDPVCTIDDITFYQQAGCSNEWRTQLP